MRQTHVQWFLVALAATALVGCAGTAGDSANGNGNGNGHEHVIVIEPGDDAQEKTQEALINAEAGHVIEFAEGKFEFNSTLSLEDAEGVTLRGAGMDKTILDFSTQAQGTGGEGIKVASGDFTIENLTLQDSASDGIKVEGVKGVTFRNVTTQWTGEASPDNGAYGIYPVLCEDVLIEDCEAYGASDAGLYVGAVEKRDRPQLSRGTQRGRHRNRKHDRRRRLRLCCHEQYGAAFWCFRCRGSKRKTDASAAFTIARSTKITTQTSPSRVPRSPACRLEPVCL